MFARVMSVRGRGGSVLPGRLRFSFSSLYRNPGRRSGQFAPARLGERVAGSALLSTDAASHGAERPTTLPLASQYDPHAVEPRWYGYWAKGDVWRPRGTPPRPGDGSASPIVFDATGEDLDSSDALPPRLSSADRERRPLPAPPRRPFTMVLPPPNVTGVLHVGHALTCSVQDSIARWRRSRGDDVRWIPGLDHAGIATQAVVLRKMDRERAEADGAGGGGTGGVGAADLCPEARREAFLAQARSWVSDKSSAIDGQLERLGLSLDWRSRFFTLDAQRSEAVTEAFVRLHEAGLIVREARAVNWSPALGTAISDIEVDHVDVPASGKLNTPSCPRGAAFGFLYNVAYTPAASGDAAHRAPLVASTTRPETLFADAALAVHPDDARYQWAVGTSVLHPLTGAEIPVVADAELVDMDFGTGVVKVTPAHDPRDFECGRRHGLPVVSVLRDDGTLDLDAHPSVRPRDRDLAARVHGMDRIAARRHVVRWLAEHGGCLVGDPVPHATSVPVCSRSGDVVEPRVLPQWFVDTQGMAADAVDAVRSGEIALVPRRHVATWERWLGDPRPWCVSRQLWWGHRIPAYCAEVPATGRQRWFVARSEAAAREQALDWARGEEFTLRRDSDVLDTWFSSAILPLSALGWPREDPAAGGGADAGGYPLSLMETGQDILFFWVARMEFLCRFLSGRSPFSSVLLHPMVRDAQGRKMSKSLGNVIDPVDVMDGVSLEQLREKIRGGNVPPAELKRALKVVAKELPHGIPACGADALRFALLSYLSHGTSINLDPRRIVAVRHLGNKVWNAVRFVLSHSCDDEATLDARLGGFGGQTRDGVVGAMIRDPQVRAEIAALRPRSLLASTFPEHAEEERDGGAAPPPAVRFSAADRWIMSRLAAAAEEVDAAMERRDLESATTVVRRFWVAEFCDAHIELAKAPKPAEDPALAAGRYTALLTCADGALRLLHPFMPFLTEELWQSLRAAGCIADSDGIASVAQCPSVLDARGGARPVRRDPSAELAVGFVLDTVHTVRSMRADAGVAKSAAIDAVLVQVPAVEADGADGPTAPQVPAAAPRWTAEAVALVEEMRGDIARLARAARVEISGAAVETRGSRYEPLNGGGGVAVVLDAAAGTTPESDRPAAGAASAPAAEAAAGGGDETRAHAAARTEMAQALKEREDRLVSLKRVADDPKFASRAPEKVRAKQAATIEAVEAEITRLRAALASDVAGAASKD